MRRPQGYAITSEPGKRDVVEDTFTCRHHGGIVSVKPFQDPSEMGGFCLKCSGHICRACSRVGGCRPLEKWLDEVEANWRRLQERRTA